MKSKFVHHRSVPPSVYHPSVSKLSVPNARISFKFWLLFPLGHGLECSLNFWKTKTKAFGIFYEYFSFSLTWEPNFQKALLLQIVSQSFDISPEISSHWSPQKRHKTIFGIFEIWSFRFFDKFSYFSSGLFVSKFGLWLVVVFNAILQSFGALVSKCLVTWN